MTPATTAPEPATGPQAPEFDIAGRTYSLADMLDANGHDVDVCDWLQAAQVGEVCPLGGEPVQRIT